MNNNYVISSMNDFIKPNVYLYRKEEGHLKFILNPKHALVFNTSESASEYIRKHFVGDDNFETITFETALARFKKHVLAPIPTHSWPEKNQELSRKYAGESADEILAWHIAVRKAENSVKFEDYKTWPILSEKFTYIFNTAQFFDQTDNKKILLTFELRTNRDGDLSKFLSELDKVIDHVTYLSEDGAKILNIFDHYLCEGGNCADLHIVNKDFWKIAGRWSDLITGTPEKVLNIGEKKGITSK